MQPTEPFESSKLTERLVLYIAEIGAGRSSITDEVVAAEPNDAVREVLVGLMQLHEDLAYQREKLQRSERLAALGELAAVVAHEVRNPLGVLFNSLGSLNRLLKPAGDVQQLLAIMGEEADRLNHIVTDLLDFARPGTPYLRPERLEQVVDNAVAAALASRPDVRLVREVDPSLPSIPMDERLIRQAVLNIALNALQAMPKGGQLTVRTKSERRPRGEMACLAMTDTGKGIDLDARAHMFEPFFTTKATGSGLGLALVKRIIEDHDGEAEVVSDLGKGTTFLLRLPFES
jgi:signal transduction histidine kinase